MLFDEFFDIYLAFSSSSAKAFSGSFSISAFSSFSARRSSSISVSVNSFGGNLRRYSDGVMPRSAKNARLKVRSVSNPTEKAICVIESAPAANL